MMKENLVKAAVGEPTGRITRARAAAYRQSGDMHSKKLSKLQDEKLNLKRPALNGRNNDAPPNPCNQPKRRAVLEDVTNVFCKNSRRKCLNATKIPVCTLSFSLFCSLYPVKVFKCRNIIRICHFQIVYVFNILILESQKGKLNPKQCLS